MSTEQGSLEQVTSDVNTVESSNTEIVANTNTDVNAQTSIPSTEVTQDVKPLSVFEAVKAGLAESEAEKIATSSEVVAEKVEATEKTDEVDANSDEDLIKSLDPKSRASTRIRELVSENKTLTGNAQNFEALSNWTKQSGLDQTEFTTGLEIMREMKNDPFKAWEMLQPYISSLQGIVGITLPDDVQARIDSGMIDEDTARELVASRNKAEHYTERERITAETNQLNAQEQAQQNHVRAISEGVSTWEKNWEKTDPDYSKKKALVKATVMQLLSEEGVPPTPKEAVEQAQRARVIVEKQLTGIMPTRQSVRTVTGGSSNNLTVKPKSSLEAARMGINGDTANY